MIEAIIFLLGSAIGSFLNVVICRLETGEGIVKKRSHCVKCGQVLVWYDLIPIVSFLWLGGKCRKCKEKISWQYPLVEIATGLLFILIFWSLGFGAWDFIGNLSFVISHWVVIGCLLYIVCSLLVIFVYDLRHYIIPDVVLFPAIGVALVYRLFGVLSFENLNLFRISDFGFRIWQLFWPYLLSALGASAFFLAIILITRGKGMGLGDAKLSFLIGLMLGWPNILAALFLAFFIGAIVGVGLILWGKKTMKSQIPFGPFLISGTVILLFFGQFFWEWQERIFF